MSNIEEVELTIDRAKEIVALRDKALKLASNREFKTLILEGYFKDEAARLVGLSADPSMEKYREDIFMNIQAISCLQRYLRQVVQFGDMAERELAQAEELMTELREEEFDIGQVG